MKLSMLARAPASIMSNARETTILYNPAVGVTDKSADGSKPGTAHNAFRVVDVVSNWTFNAPLESTAARKSVRACGLLEVVIPKFSCTVAKGIDPVSAPIVGATIPKTAEPAASPTAGELLPAKIAAFAELENVNCQ
jgi:hypothetical protein